MPGCDCTHQGLGAKFLGVTDNRYGSRVTHFRGIPYGNITERFAKATRISKWQNETVDATKFGPLCPQPQVEVGHLLRLPPGSPSQISTYDEFKCLNLNIHCPGEWNDTTKIPVIIWIHGGSQLITFASASEPVCDPTRIVSQSVTNHNPIIFVTVNYRLNIFAFGDGESEVNLALKDQLLAIEWVAQHIGGFGGDKDNITLAGESAGAVYTHAHILSELPVQKAILASGSLSLSPPLPLELGKGLVGRLAKVIDDQDPGKSLRTASASSLVQALDSCQVRSLWLQHEERFSGWRDKHEKVDTIMSVLWRNGIEDMTTAQIFDSFEAADHYSDALIDLYHVDVNRPTQSKLAALDFLNDARFGLPVYQLVRRWEQSQKPIYQILIDESNPWQASSRPHHAVDLILLFGGFDMTQNPGAEAVGERLRECWIAFANSGKPWSGDRPRHFFGPLGKHGDLVDAEYALRRRVQCLEFLDKMPLTSINAVFGQLAAGRISLLN